MRIDRERLSGSEEIDVVQLIQTLWRRRLLLSS